MTSHFLFKQSSRLRLSTFSGKQISTYIVCPKDNLAISKHWIHHAENDSEKWAKWDNIRVQEMVQRVFYTYTIFSGSKNERGRNAGWCLKISASSHQELLLHKITNQSNQLEITYSFSHSSSLHDLIIIIQGVSFIHPSTWSSSRRFGTFCPGQNILNNNQLTISKTCT